MNTIYHEHTVQNILKYSFADIFRERWPFRHKLGISPSRMQLLEKESSASAWHSYAINSRHWRRHVCIACGWIADHVPSGASIFEPGCGSGANLLWLATRGFCNVSGSDIDNTALHLCNALQKEMKLFFPVWEDDGLNPQKLPHVYDVLLSVNWLYHIKRASLKAFFEMYLHSLSNNGVVVCDVVDSSYDNIKNNIYHSDDSKKPVHARRPSEYTFRMSKDDVTTLAAKHDLRLRRYAKVYSIPPRAVYMLGK